MRVQVPRQLHRNRCENAGDGWNWYAEVVTGPADTPLAIEAIGSGAFDFIKKPFEAEVLLGLVRAAARLLSYRTRKKGRESQRLDRPKMAAPNLSRLVRMALSLK